jgi:hypothetical protein
MIRRYCRRLLQDKVVRIGLARPSPKIDLISSHYAVATSLADHKDAVNAFSTARNQKEN